MILGVVFVCFVVVVVGFFWSFVFVFVFVFLHSSAFDDNHFEEALNLTL